MEYGSKICGEGCQFNYMKHVGWAQTVIDEPCYNSLFTEDTIRNISKQITKLTLGVDKDNRPIVVPDETICSVMSNVYDSRQPEVGDIHTRYIIPKSGPVNQVQVMIDRTIEIITSQIKNEFGMRQWNESLSIWDTVLGDFNSAGLRRHSQIKIRRKNTSHRGEVSFMNY